MTRSSSANALAHAIIEETMRLPARTPTRLVAVGGAPGLGKTTTCARLARMLRARGYNSRHLRLDMFLRDRNWRHDRELRGFEPESFRWDELRAAVSAASRGDSFACRPFVQTRGEISRNTLHWANTTAAIVWLDGTMALHRDIIDASVLRVYFDGPNDWLREERLRADVARGYDRREAERRLEINVRQFRVKIASLRALLDFVVWCDRNHQYSLWPAARAPRSETPVRESA